MVEEASEEAGSTKPAPRIFGIPALRAPIVAVLRRGPTDWSHVGRWDVEAGVYTAGSWIHGTFYPQRSDVSPDGRWFCYFALKSSAQWPAGWTYVALSRLPWLTALAAWGTGGTWTRGAHFVEDRTVWHVGPPDVGDAAPCRERFGLAVTRPSTFAVERRRGWTETSDTPPRAASDHWDEQRAAHVKMEKPRPGSMRSMRLVVGGYFAAFRETSTRSPRDTEYVLVEDGRSRALGDVQWADWDAAGRLLVATTDGRIQVRDPEAEDFAVLWDFDLSSYRPTPEPPPEEAARW